MCRTLGISRSGYYAWLKRPEIRRKIQNRELLKQIRQTYKVSRGTYGSPRITKALKKNNITCGKNRVARLMSEHGIVAKTKKKYKATTIQNTIIRLLKTLLTRTLPRLYANMTLDGLEKLIQYKYHRNSKGKVENHYRAKTKVNLVRYADDCAPRRREAV